MISLRESANRSTDHIRYTISSDILKTFIISRSISNHEVQNRASLFFEMFKLRKGLSDRIGWFQNYLNVSVIY